MYCRSDRDLIGDNRNIRDYWQNRRDIRGHGSGIWKQPVNYNKIYWTLLHRWIAPPSPLTLSANVVIGTLVQDKIPRHPSWCEACVHGTSRSHQVEDQQKPGRVQTTMKLPTAICRSLVLALPCLHTTVYLQTAANGSPEPQNIPRQAQVAGRQKCGGNAPPVVPINWDPHSKILRQGHQRDIGEQPDGDWRLHAIRDVPDVPDRIHRQPPADERPTNHHEDGQEPRSSVTESVDECVRPCTTKYAPYYGRIFT